MASFPVPEAFETAADTVAPETADVVPLCVCATTISTGERAKFAEALPPAARLVLDDGTACPSAATSVTVPLGGALSAPQSPATTV